MSTTEVAAVVVAGASVLGVVVVAVLFLRLNRSVAEVTRAVEQLRFDATSIPVRSELATAVEAQPKLAKDTGTFVAKVARANPVVDVSDPVIKVLALAAGTGRAASRFRRARTDRS